LSDFELPIIIVLLN